MVDACPSKTWRLQSSPILGGKIRCAWQILSRLGRWALVVLIFAVPGELHAGSQSRVARSWFTGDGLANNSVDAIVETRHFEFHFESRKGTVITKQELLAVGDKYEAQIAQDRAADAPYR